MSIQNDILNELEEAVRSDSSLSNANVYKRGERKEDRIGTAGVDIYLRPLPPTPAENPFVLDGRTYPVEVTLRYVEETSAVDESMRDVVVEQGSFYVDALLRAFRFGQITYPTGVYHHEFSNSEADPEAPEGQETQTGMSAHRVRIRLDFHALVDPNTIDAGGASDDDSTSVVIDGGWN